MTEHADLSPTDWVCDQTEAILKSRTTDGVEVLDRPIVLFTTTGAKSGKKRYVPLMRVEENGRYAMVASKGGDPEDPSWYFDVKANPTVTAQDGDKVVTLTAREVSGEKRERPLHDRLAQHRRLRHHDGCGGGVRRRVGGHVADPVGP
jgi:F420H(2)-dependent quinone reductase